LHLHDNFVCLNAGLLHRMLTIHQCSGALGVPQQQVVKIRPHDVVGKGWLKRGLLKCKGTGCTSFILIIERGSRLDNEARLAHRIVAAQMIENGEIRWQQRFPNVKPWKMLPFTERDAQAVLCQQRRDRRTGWPSAHDEDIIRVSNA
jgi:hypothetical protein